VREAIYLDGLALIDFGNTLSFDAIEFFNWLGNQDVEVFIERRKNDHLPGLLADAIKSYPENVGLLRALSWWITKESEVQVPTMFLDCDKYVNDSLKEAVLTIKLNQGGLNPENTSRVAQWSADFIRSRQVSSILFESSSLPPSVSWALFTKLLVEVRSLLPSSRWEQEAKIIQRLNESISRRTSRLGAQDVWMALGMPQGLITLLPHPETQESVVSSEHGFSGDV
jgi:hypothetical protein